MTFNGAVRLNPDSGPKHLRKTSAESHLSDLIGMTFDRAVFESPLGI